MDTLDWKSIKNEVPIQNGNDFPSHEILIRKKYKTVSGKTLYHFDVCWYIYSEKRFVSVAGEHSITVNVDDWAELNREV